LIASDIIDALKPVVEALEQLGVAYHIGGSVASSVYGIPRTTLDVDLVADLEPEHVQPLVDGLQESYYLDRDMVSNAIQRRAFFNVIHYATMIKIVVFIPKQQSFDQIEFQRVHKETLEEPVNTTDAYQFYLASPEDVILRKLDWYKSGGGVSERQWNDVLGVLKVQATALGHAYLRQWAAHLGLEELLDQAMEEAGL
jgi:hypothetical protein